MQVNSTPKASLLIVQAIMLTNGIRIKPVIYVLRSLLTGFNIYLINLPEIS